MKITKSQLKKIIQEEIENLMSKEEKTPLQKAVEDAKPLADAPMSTVGITLPSWLITGKPTELDKLKAKFPELKNLKPAQLKKALGIACLDPYEQPIPCDKFES